MPSALGLGLALDLEIGQPCEVAPTWITPLPAGQTYVCNVSNGFYCKADGCLLQYRWYLRRYTPIVSSWDYSGQGDGNGNFAMIPPCYWQTLGEVWQLKCEVTNPNGSIDSIMTFVY